MTTVDRLLAKFYNNWKLIPKEHTIAIRISQSSVPATLRIKTRVNSLSMTTNAARAVNTTVGFTARTCAHVLRYGFG